MSRVASALKILHPGGRRGDSSSLREQGLRSHDAGDFQGVECQTVLAWQSHQCDARLAVACASPGTLGFSPETALWGPSASWEGRSTDHRAARRKPTQKACHVGVASAHSWSKCTENPALPIHFQVGMRALLPQQGRAGVTAWGWRPWWGGDRPRGQAPPGLPDGEHLPPLARALVTAG